MTSNNSSNINESESNDSNCSICLSEIENETKVIICNHHFCLKCIQGWIKNKIECPLCKSVSENKYIDVEPPAKPHPSKVEADLACLDHSYFAEEINKLIVMSQAIAFKVENTPSINQTTKVYVNNNNQHDLTLLVSIDETLHRLHGDMEALTPFDPQSMLSEIYSIETTLKDLDRIYNNYNRQASIQKQQNNSRYTPSSSSSKLRSNNNSNDDDDDDYQDDYFEDNDRYYESVDDGKQQRYAKSK
ncbi:hypothetical protein PPL_01436 [Heterostelium album PN500]|uniref:RING-type E3 ubiquitin transferase n=1 Tax=Heterostelium pallidum (strain ATCC 26659 / Pp 5 / PN500) TaxID=670386 RepID=D3AZ96_HETP5|nr:hypothetical protein PPL_01436 [Heterostelium album PN500]EFA85479.1 hypothetical protein PPL_01436 [Heterostelium album PN500]|eukprot:XP_020437587.1 hypothetical protein PPL_01436 [Heterostelium album PN500]